MSCLWYFFYSGLVALTGCKWFHVNLYSSVFLSWCLLLLCFIALTASGWFHVNSNHLSYNYSFHSCHFTLIGSEWLCIKSSYISPQSPYFVAVFSQQKVSDFMTDTAELIIIPSNLGVLTGCKWFYTQFFPIFLSNLILLHCQNVSNHGSTQYSAIYFLITSFIITVYPSRLWVIPCSVSHGHFIHFGPVYFIGSEQFHMEPSCSLLYTHFFNLVLLTWQRVSMPADSAVFVLIVHPLTLVILTWQEVSGFMSSSPVSLLMVIFPSLALLAWQNVRSYMRSNCDFFSLFSHSSTVTLIESE